MNANSRSCWARLFGGELHHDHGCPAAMECCTQLCLRVGHLPVLCNARRTHPRNALTPCLLGLQKIDVRMGYAFIEFDDQRDAEEAVAGEPLPPLPSTARTDARDFVGTCRVSRDGMTLKVISAFGFNAEVG